MTENIIETIRKAVQDLVAPEVRQIKADVGALGAKVDVLDSKFESKFDALHAEYDALRSEVSSPRLWAPPTRDTRPWRVSVRQSVPPSRQRLARGWGQKIMK
ncbi:MAG TPA: hypothetical protein VF772_22465 [Terriglobales bacterium]